MTLKVHAFVGLVGYIKYKVSIFAFLILFEVLMSTLGFEGLRCRFAY